MIQHEMEGLLSHPPAALDLACVEAMYCCPCAWWRSLVSDLSETAEIHGQNLQKGGGFAKTFRATLALICGPRALCLLRVPGSDSYQRAPAEKLQRTTQDHEPIVAETLRGIGWR